MRAKKGILGLVYAGSEVRRAPLIGMQFLHQGAVRPADVVTPRPRLQAKDLIGLLVRHFAARRRAALPPCRISLRVLTPGGNPAVRRAHTRRTAFRAEPRAHGRPRRQFDWSQGPPGRWPAPH